MFKDVRFISQAASKHGTKLPVNEAVCQLLERAAREGYDDQDLMAVTRVLTKAMKGEKHI